jgi:hypothetical protein
MEKTIVIRITREGGFLCLRNAFIAPLTLKKDKSTMFHLYPQTKKEMNRFVTNVIMNGLKD